MRAPVRAAFRYASLLSRRHDARMDRIRQGWADSGGTAILHGMSELQADLLGPSSMSRHPFGDLWNAIASIHGHWGTEMARPKFTEEQCKEFEDAANPHQWLLSADRLHVQAVELYDRRGRGMLVRVGVGVPTVSWNETNKATFLLCAFALENAIKAFLVYEHPNWVSDGYLHDEICSHRLVTLSRKSTLIRYRNRDEWVLAAFEEGNESWMRYPCSRRADDLQIEPQLPDKLWGAYLRVMRGYAFILMRLLRNGWRGPHGFAGSWEMTDGWLGAQLSKPIRSERPLLGGPGQKHTG